MYLTCFAAIETALARLTSYNQAQGSGIQRGMRGVVDSVETRANHDTLAGQVGREGSRKNELWVDRASRLRWGTV